MPLNKERDELDAARLLPVYVLEVQYVCRMSHSLPLQLVGRCIFSLYKLRDTRKQLVSDNVQILLTCYSCKDCLSL